MMITKLKMSCKYFVKMNIKLVNSIFFHPIYKNIYKNLK